MDYNNTEYNAPDDNKTISSKSWFLYILICFIPVVNIVFLLTNALSEKNDANIKSFARAALIWVLLGVTIGLLGLMCFASMIR